VFVNFDIPSLFSIGHSVFDISSLWVFMGVVNFDIPSSLSIGHSVFDFLHYGYLWVLKKTINHHVIANDSEVTSTKANQ